MTSRYRESEMWRKLNTEFIRDPREIDLSTFRDNAINTRISTWEIQSNALRFYKTLLFNSASALEPRALALLDRIDNRNLGRPIQVEVGGRRVCMDYLQCLYEVDFLEKYLVGISSILEIGTGFGRTCHAMLSLFDDIEKYVVVDLPPCLELTRRYLMQTLGPDKFSKIVFVSAEELPERPDLEVDLVINIDSMAEMDRDVVFSYLDFIHRNSRRFYCKNPVGKYSPESVGAADASVADVALAMSTGILTDIVDIFDSDALDRARSRFVQAYLPAKQWRLIEHSAAPPWTYYHQALYAKEAEE